MAGKAGGLKGVALIGGGANSTVAGALHFFQDPSTGYTEVRGKVTGLAPGMHGFHIHFFGDTTNGCNSTEVALLRSSQNKLYVLPLDIVCDGKEKTMPRVLGSYTLESLEKVSVGLGLQALRVHMIDSKTHLFLTRTSKEAQDVLGLLSVTNFPKLNHEIDLQSWENIQVKLFEKCICGSAKMGIFLYFMLMFWRNDAEDHTEFDIEEFHDSNQRNGHLSHNSVHLVGQKGRQKFKRRVFPFKNHNGTKPETIKINGDQVDEHVLVEGNGHLTCNSSKSTHKEEGSESQYLRILPNNASTNIISSNIDEHKIVKDFFNLEVANNDKSETCEQVARCACLFLDASATVQREVALLRSSQNKLYVLLLDVVCDGKETMPRVLGSYTLESLEKVSIGLGLQALSWENIQVKLFEKCICGSAKMGIFLYSMLMFWRNDAEDFGRSHWVSLMDLSSTRPIYSAFNLLGATRMPSSFVDPPSSFWNFVAMAGCYSASIVFRSVVFPAGGRVADGIDFRLLMGITESDLESATPM